jgi:hypothetical protein
LTMPTKSDVMELQYKVDRASQDVVSKVDQRDFDDFDEVLRKKIEEI